MKTFYLKVLVLLATLGGIYLSLSGYYVYTQYKNFQIINERQSVIIQLPNSEYIEIASRNDHITNHDDFLEKPFNVNSKIQKNSNLENSIVRTDIYTEYIENGNKNSREVRITPTDNKTLEIYISTKTAYIYDPSLKYNIQLDYSNRTEYKEEEGFIYFEDKGCRVEIHDKTVGYEITKNNQTVILSKDYDLELEYNIKMVINCKK